MKNTDTALTDRQRQILQIVVQEYTHTALPVGSSSIVKQYDLGVSSATIRNELAALEKEGLLTHPHTSAGRVPTDAGYRYFVRNLLDDVELPPAERRNIRQEFTLVRQDMDQWLRLSTSVLARAAQAAALATAPRSHTARYKHVELVAIHGIKILLILVLEQGTVKQQILDLDQPMEQSELSRISNELNDQLAGLSATEIQERRKVLSPFARQVCTLVLDIMRRGDGEPSRPFYRDGLTQILDAPEFAEGEDVRRIVQVFEKRSVLEQIVGEFNEADDIHVVISGDGRIAELRDISIVMARYGVMNRATGILGVIGPLRMSYGRSMSAVRFVATLLSEIMEDVYGPEGLSK